MVYNNILLLKNQLAIFLNIYGIQKLKLTYIRSIILWNDLNLNFELCLVIYNCIFILSNRIQNVCTVEPRLSKPPLYEPSIIQTIISVSERSVIRK